MKSTLTHRRATVAIALVLLASLAAPADAADPKASPPSTPTVDPNKPPSDPNGPTVLAPIPGMSSAGPLTNIRISADLNCSVNHEADAFGEFYSDTACATLLVVDSQLYGPNSIPAGSAATPRVTFQAVSQVTSGSGTTEDPLKTVTTVNAGTTGIVIVEEDSYIIGREWYRTSVTVENHSGLSKGVIVYRAGDCFLQDSDLGFGRADAATGAVGCVAATTDGSGNPVPGMMIEEWLPPRTERMPRGRPPVRWPWQDDWWSSRS